MKKDIVDLATPFRELRIYFMKKFNPELTDKEVRERCKGKLYDRN